jgi:branched-chain amino acid transport system substrate-binding protein
VQHYSRKTASLAGVLFGLVFGLLPQAAWGAGERPAQLKVGVFTFVSGPAASYGMPAKNAADLMFESLNAGGGLAGVRLEPVFVDEAQGTDAVVSEFRRLVTSRHVPVMIAALSSANCLALAPVAEQLKTPMIAWNCDTHHLFLKKKYRYVFRANTSTVPEFVAYAAYLLQKKADVSRVGIIDPDYAFGHDAAVIFSETLRRFRPDSKLVVELYPRLGSPSYSTEISRLLAAHPAVIFTNFWGADLENFVRQALPRKLFSQSLAVIALGTTVFEEFGQRFPQGAVVGVLGDGWYHSPAVRANPQAQRFIKNYQERFHQVPVFPAFKMANAVLVVEAAYRRALRENKGQWPDSERLARALEGLRVKTLTGPLTLRADHDGLTDQIVGVSRNVAGSPYPVMADMVRYPGELVTPPVDADPIQWIKTLPADYLERLPKPGSYGP